jgi:hypothetical protein
LTAAKIGANIQTLQKVALNATNKNINTKGGENFERKQTEGKDC